ncbi:hypothetical protein PR048_011351 [Dryococelus australis]|uniref:Uncharacterized protein n=1 Tax=Dryococelus australis TaxID=614101 RepID=A0ABQ9HLJ1_9NEOP|nr:hypothetical protein PR048_011351 [Dryococelus australis]
MLSICTYNARVRVLKFYVVEKDSSPILEPSACMMLDLVRKVETCFEGIGELPGNYKMILREDAKPVVHAPRRIAAALMEPLRQELNSGKAYRMVFWMRNKGRLNYMRAALTIAHSILLGDATSFYDCLMTYVQPQKSFIINLVKYFKGC